MDRPRSPRAAHLAGVVEHDDLGGEVGHAARRLVLGVRSDVAPLDVLHRDVLDVEANVVAGDGLGQRLVVHLDGLDLGGELHRGEGDDLPGLDDAGLHAAHGHCADPADFVNILEGQPEGLVGGPAGGDDGVHGLQQGQPVGLALLPLHGPALGGVGQVLNEADQE